MPPVHTEATVVPLSSRERLLAASLPEPAPTHPLPLIAPSSARNDEHVGPPVERELSPTQAQAMQAMIPP
jgi:hypothetical protein